MLLIKFISWLATLKYRIFCGGRVKFGKNLIANFKLKIAGPGIVEIGDNVNLWAFAEPNLFLTFDPAAKIVVGAGTRINGATLQARESIIIGQNCLLGSTIIMDNDFHHADPKKRHSKLDIPTKPVIIDNNVWLAGQSAVLKGVTVGQNSVVGFRAVVAKNVPANVTVVGNPAREV